MTCPSCGAALPEPRERFCPQCGFDLEAAAPVESPLTTPRPRTGTPWEDRGRIGFVPALVETTQKVLTRPSEFFAAMPVTGGIGGPLLYGILIGTLGVVVAAIYREVFQALVGSTFAGLGGGSGELQRVLPFLMGGVGLVLQVVFAPIFVTLGLFVVAAIAHLFLLLFGGAKRGFEATFRVMCYSEAAAVINIIPICGGVISAVYYLVVAIIGLAAAHGIGKGTAAAAVLLPLVVVCCCCVGGALIAAGSLASFLSQMK
jgi:hypothetical protein